MRYLLYDQIRVDFNFLGVLSSNPAGPQRVRGDLLFAKKVANRRRMHSVVLKSRPISIGTI